MKYIQSVMCVLLAVAACAAAECQHGALYPNPADCTTFYQCSFNQLFRLNCYPGLTFNPPLDRCDYPSDDDACHLAWQERTTVTCPPFNPDGEAVHLPNPDSCTTYYTCDERDVPILQECPPGLHFNAVLKVCDFPSDAGCEVARLATNVQCPPFNPEEDAVHLPNPDSCTSFYKCNEKDVPILHDCPPGLHYNAVLGVCDYPANAGCEVARLATTVQCPPFNPEEDAVHLPNPDSCTSFYKCDERDVPVLHDCPPGLHYNAALGVCDYPANAGCEVVRRVANVQCPPFDPEGEAQHLPNPDSCTTYYTCDERDVPILQDCPPGLHFNAALGVCDFPWDAGCESSSRQ